MFSLRQIKYLTSEYQNPVLIEHIYFHFIQILLIPHKVNITFFWYFGLKKSVIFSKLPQDHTEMLLEKNH
jgi:hypothetical protein